MLVDINKTNKGKKYLKDAQVSSRLYQNIIKDLIYHKNYKTIIKSEESTEIAKSMSF